MKLNYIGYVVATAAGLTVGLLINQDTSVNQAQSETAQAIQISAGNSSANNHSAEPAQPKSSERSIPAAVFSNGGGTLETLVATSDLFKRIDIAHSLAKQADERQIELLIEQLNELESDKNMASALRVFFLRYASLNPEAALDKYSQLFPSPSYAIRDILYTLYHHFGANDLDGMLRYIDHMSDESKQYAALRYLVDDPHFNQNPNLIDQARAFSPQMSTYVAKVLSGSNDAFFDTLLNMGLEGKALSREVYKLLHQWVKEDPQQAFARISQLMTEDEGQPNAERWMTRLLRLWAERAPQDAMTTVLASPSLTHKAEIILRKVAQKNPHQALQLFEAHKEQLEGKTRDEIFEKWMDKDADSALAYISQMSKEEQSAILSVRGVMVHYSRAKPFKAFNQALQLGLVKQEDTASMLARMATARDLTKSRQLWQSMEPSGVKDSLFKQILYRMADKDIDTAKTWLAQNRHLSRKADDAEAYMIINWASKDPEAAARHSIAMEDERQRSRNVSMSISSWYRQQPQQAIDFVLTMSSGPGKDTAISVIFLRVAGHDRPLARKLVDAIGNPQLRQRLEEQL